MIEVCDFVCCLLLFDELDYYVIVIDLFCVGVVVQVCEIVFFQVDMLVWVSCDLVIFVKDVWILVERKLDIVWFYVVDQFCWLLYVEIVVEIC